MDVLSPEKSHSQTPLEATEVALCPVLRSASRYVDVVATAAAVSLQRQVLRIIEKREQNLLLCAAKAAFS